MEQSIKSKLSISIAFIVVLTVLLISILSNLIIKNEFTKYKEKQQLGKIEEIVNSIQDQYNIKENKYALAYAAAKYFNTRKTGNKKVDEYILRMH